MDDGRHEAERLGCFLTAYPSALGDTELRLFLSMLHGGTKHPRIRLHEHVTRQLVASWRQRGAPGERCAGKLDGSTGQLSWAAYLRREGAPFHGVEHEALRD